ncbi:MAG TPA: nuclear transport factor 2 family protein [Ohtaekwangia sp.]|uniref:nuclear transport factor 2 family protein n=1 Tax=Ohtaekwangia sp. TaxID=2066019 RepID=UPI002F93EF0B
MVIEQRIDVRELLHYVYTSFNARNIDAALEVIHPDADWANTMEGGLVKGHEGIRDCWSRQWSYIDPHVKLIDVEVDEEGRVVADAHQIIRDMTGAIVSIRDIQHIFEIEDGLLRTMRIR